MGLASGFAPLSYIDNSTSTPLNYCIRVLSDGGLDPVFTGRNVSCCCASRRGRAQCILRQGAYSCCDPMYLIAV